MNRHGDGLGILSLEDWRGDDLDPLPPATTREEMLVSFADAVSHLTRAVRLIEAKNAIILELEAEVADLRHNLRRIIGSGRQVAMGGNLYPVGGPQEL